MWLPDSAALLAVLGVSLLAALGLARAWYIHFYYVLVRATDAERRQENELETREAGEAEDRIKAVSPLWQAISRQALAIERQDGGRTWWEKTQGRLYARLVPVQADRAASKYPPNADLVRWVARALRRLQGARPDEGMDMMGYWTFLAAAGFAAGSVLLAMLLAASVVATGMPWRPLGGPVVVGMTPVTPHLQRLYEVLPIAGVQRMVPYCEHYERATELFHQELVTSDTPGLRSHARCVLRPEDRARVLSYGLEHYEQDMGLAPALVDLLKDYNHTMHASGADTYAQAPHVFILRNGDRYVRLVVRSDDGKRLEPRMVRESSILALLHKWQHDVTERVGVAMPFCLPAPFMGILDNVAFYFNRAAGEWEIWYYPEIVRVQELSEKRRSAITYRKGLGLFPYAQYNRTLGLCADPHGRNHVNVHHDGITVRYYDPAGRLDVPADLDALEPYWLGITYPGAPPAKRTHEAANPVALAVPLSASKHRRERILTGEDTACFYSSQHIRELLQQL